MDAAHVQAVPLDDGSWYLDLWSAQLRLLALGSAPAEEVAALASALTDDAARRAPDGPGAAHRRFNETARTLRATERAAPDEARVRAAFATSPTRTLAGSVPAPAVPSAGTRPAHPAASRHSR